MKPFKRHGILGLGQLVGIVFVAALGAGAAVLYDAEWRGWLGLQPEDRGVARVIDGDTIAVNGTTIRLVGIDAPELRQTCQRAGRDWPCGAEARDALQRLLDGRDVACTERGRDRNGRTLAVCRRDGIADIGAALVGAGWAVSWDASYLAEEGEAQRLGRGLWSGTFDRPRDWRRAHRGDVD